MHGLLPIPLARQSPPPSRARGKFSALELTLQAEKL